MSTLPPTRAAAERILYATWAASKVFISNTHFDTTRANIESSLTPPPSTFPSPMNALMHPFRRQHGRRVGPPAWLEILAATWALSSTVTNNSGGGNP